MAFKIEDLLRTIIEGNEIDIHMVESRAKTVLSFQEKLTRPGKIYSNGLSDLADLCGSRIIAFYQDDCEKIGAIIKAEFNVWEEELSHSMDRLESDRFGYIATHYVATLGAGRADLVEWKPYAGVKFEVQVRTVVQHAWSAVSHAVQYKQETRIPSKLQRRLYRIAGLFELADEEFVGIREQKRLLLEEAAQLIESKSLEIPLSSSTIEEFIKSWPSRKKMVAAARRGGFSVSKKIEGGYVAEIYSLLSSGGVTTVDQMAALLNSADFRVFRKIMNCQDEDAAWTIDEEFAVYLVLLTKFPEVVTKEFLKEAGWSREPIRDVLKAIAELET